MAQEIVKFMAGYAASFAASDREAICSFWAFPATISVGEALTCFPTKGEFLANLEALLAFYRGQGVVRAEKEIVSCRFPLPSCVQVTTGDRLYAASGDLIATWLHHYTLRLIEGQWRIVFAVADEEIAAWERAGSPLG